MDAFRDALMDCGLEDLGFLEILSLGREGES
jgi:Mn-containing catalase